MKLIVNNRGWNNNHHPMESVTKFVFRINLIANLKPKLMKIVSDPMKKPKFLIVVFIKKIIHFPLKLV